MKIEDGVLELPEVFEVNEDLYLIGTKITKTPKILRVHGSLYITGCSFVEKVIAKDLVEAAYIEVNPYSIDILGRLKEIGGALIAKYGARIDRRVKLPGLGKLAAGGDEYYGGYEVVEVLGKKYIHIKKQVFELLKDRGRIKVVKDLENGEILYAVYGTGNIIELGKTVREARIKTAWSIAMGMNDDPDDYKKSRKQLSLEEAIYCYVEVTHDYRIQEKLDKIRTKRKKFSLGYISRVTRNEKFKEWRKREKT